MAEDRDLPEEIDDGFDDGFYEEAGPAYAEPVESPEIPPSQHRWRVGLFRWSWRSILRWAVAIALTILVVIVFSKMILEPVLFESESEEPDRAGFPADSDWPPGVAVTSHSVPAIIRNEVSAQGEQHGYEFEGTAGQVWQITVDSLESSRLDPVIILYGPSGVEVASSDDRSAGDTGSELRIALPESGIYRLLVKSSLGGITTGGYWMEVWIE